MNSRALCLRTTVIENQDGRIVEALIAASFLQRLRGLLGRKRLDVRQGLLLEECNAVHTIGMRFAIDVIFLSADFRILAMHSHVGAFRFRRCPKAAHTLELAAGQAAGLQWTVGDALALR
ncbi:DUF192 domain-containing protein [Allohahella marinimesophila]|uniref:DUF192 domain-containing protein n=1 Tax=Allohahella marinimesophila TaxID=1054972 RepID=A0ABP7PRM3_9GAMM